MSKISPVNGFVIVEQFDKVRKKSDSSPFTSVVSSNNLGTVKYTSSADFPVGLQVYFGGKHERLMIDGHELLAIDIKDVIAKVLEDTTEQGV